MEETNKLHLPNLTIKGFRGIDELTIPRMGRATLLTGKNSVGKTTVLDAIRVYAARGRSRVLTEILKDREELLESFDNNGRSVVESDWAALFFDRDPGLSEGIKIGPLEEGEQLSIELSSVSDTQASFFSPDIVAEGPLRVLKAVFRYTETPLTVISRGRVTASYHHRPALLHQRFQDYRRLLDEAEPFPDIFCELIGPGTVSNHDFARYWDGVVLTDQEEQTAQILQLIFGNMITGVRMIGEGRRTGGVTGRRLVVGLKGRERPVPLKSLGDGALRLFGTDLAIAYSLNGFLLIDEAENGIHYTLQRDFWRMVLQAAHENNVQVVATTHSWDCVRGFARAAQESEDAEGVLVRLSRQYGDLRAVEYSEEELAIAAKQGIEVR